MTDEEKKWIDDADYEQLLRRWRLSPCGDLMFTGETGRYYGEVLRKKRELLDHDAQIATSKRVGW